MKTKDTGVSNDRDDHALHAAGNHSDNSDSFRSFAPDAEFMRRAIFVVLLGVLVALIFKGLSALLLFFAATVLAVVFHALTKGTQRFLPGPRGISLALVVVGFFAVFVAAGLLLIPQVAPQVSELAKSIPSAYQRFAETQVGQAVLGAAPTGDDATGDQVAKSPKVPFDISVLGKAANVASTAVSALASLGLTVILAIFLAASPHSSRNGLISIFPLALRPRVGEVVDACAYSLWRWAFCQGFAMLIIGILAVAAYSLIGLKFALALGVIAGLFQIIPYLGPALGAVPALITAFATSSRMFLMAVGVYLLIQALEGNVITPLILKRQAYLPPVVTIMATVVFSLLFGVLGAALATPLVVVFLTLYRRVYQRDILGAEIESHSKK